VVITYTNSVGCLANFNLTVNPSPQVSAGQDITVCSGGSVTLNGSGATSYVWNNGVNDGVAFTPQQSGTFVVNGVDANGCTKTDTVVVTIAPAINATVNIAGCDSVIWNNQTYYTSNSLQFQDTTASGCDSTTTVNITVFDGSSSVDSVTHCGSYTWNGLVHK